MEGEIEKQHNECHRNGYNVEQAVLCLLHFLKLAAPFGPIRRLNEGRDFGLGRGNSTGQISSSNSEFDGNQPTTLLAVDGRGAGTNEAAGSIVDATGTHGRHEIAKTAARRAG